MNLVLRQTVSCSSHFAAVAAIGAGPSDERQQNPGDGASGHHYIITMSTAGTIQSGLGLPSPTASHNKWKNGQSGHIP